MELSANIELTEKPELKTC
jgi:hypothetical protein